MSGAEASWLPDRRRLHLHHGPIDLIVSAEGPGRERAFEAAVARIDGLLERLVAELDMLRRPIGPKESPGVKHRAAPVPPPSGRALHAPPDRPGAALTKLNDPTAIRMIRAVSPYTTFVTPMAAVAGAVADEILTAMTEHQLTKAVVNNGGDIAFHIAHGETFRAASPAGPIEITAEEPPRGIATSGWRGRSHSLGIADAVTVLARTAAGADVAATLIANAVDLPGHPGVARTQANTLSPDSDLGARLVTTDVRNLTKTEVQQALDRGTEFARTCLAKELILAATLTLGPETRLVTQDQKALTHA